MNIDDKKQKKEKKIFTVKDHSNSQTVNIAIDTILKKKQGLVFVASKASAEKQAQDIVRECKENFYSEEEILFFKKISHQVLHSLSIPTTQCKKLSDCIKYGVAFHHSGLTSEQRTLIEDAFRENKIKIICSTPTLAAGLDLPAFRTILNSLKRFGNYGMSYIPVMEYKQMAGRAGRPGKEDFGEAIIIASNEKQKQELIDNFIHGEVEEILSKLAVEPVLRTYILSLISTGIVKTKKECFDFFDKTFWAYQFKDTPYLHKIIEKMLKLLIELKFIESKSKKTEIKDEFISANEISDDKYVPTRLGKRISELYLDPLTADYIIKSIDKLEELKTNNKLKDISFIQMVCSTMELRPYLRLKEKDWNDVQEKITEYKEFLVKKEPELYEEDYDEYFDQFQTALMIMGWANEESEQELLNRFAIRPGEIRAKVEIADWIVYSAIEISKIIGHNDFVLDLTKIRIRIKDGVKEELLSLLKLKGIGRVRARKLFNSGIKTSDEAEKTETSVLEKILGKKTAENITGTNEKVKNISNSKNHRLDSFF